MESDTPWRDTAWATSEENEVKHDLKVSERAMWALGDYHRFAKETVWELGPVLVEACGISKGQQVLDVAAGSGNVAIRAAEAGANVVAFGPHAGELRGGPTGGQGEGRRT